MNISQQLGENIITLLLTAIITGFLIPYIFKRIDDRKEMQQKETDERKRQEQQETEAKLARQNKIIDAQVTFLESLAELLWEHQLLAIMVSYYYIVVGNNEYQQAVDKYHAMAGQLLGRIRGEISKSLRLSPQTTYELLTNFYYKDLLMLDRRLEDLIRTTKEGKDTKDGWAKFNISTVREFAKRIDELINEVALSLQLKERNVDSKTAIPHK